MTMQEQLRALIARNHAKLMQQLGVVSQLLAQTDASGALPQAVIAEMEGITHQMKGAAGSIGFPEISRAAAALDENLKALQKQHGAVPHDQLQTCVELLGALQRLARGTTPENSAHYNTDLSKLAR
jgi:HPt (histidine-containing phosphotransfer) domain-containing protein